MIRLGRCAHLTNLLLGSLILTACSAGEESRSRASSNDNTETDPDSGVHPDGAVINQPDGSVHDANADTDLGKDTADLLEDAETEHLGCRDTCRYGTVADTGQVCLLWDEVGEAWIDIGNGSSSTHHRARLYNAWLHQHNLPAGGVADAIFTDGTLTTFDQWGGTGDSAIWTGTYLAAEAFRAQVTQSPEAKESVGQLVRTIHDWWNVSGDKAYLTRFAAPASSDPKVLALFGPHSPDEDYTAIYKGELWHYKGHISRDQHQGVILGLSLAYEATDDEAIKELIREDMVEFVEHLMVSQSKTVLVSTSSFGTPIPMNLTLRYCIYTTSETASGNPEIYLNLDDIESSTSQGFLEFGPRFYNEVANQIPGLGWLPEVARSGSAIMLAAAFRGALLVTEGVPAYASRRAAIQQHYDDNVGWWLDVAENPNGYKSAYTCGSKYYSHNIRFEPMYNLARLETDPLLLGRIRGNVLTDLMWPLVHDHKNVFFAYIFAANQTQDATIQSIADFHTNQLNQFRVPPNANIAVDLSGLYPEDPKCPGLSTEAVDVGHRAASDFMWQRHPWKLFNEDISQLVYPGVDYMVAYWMGRHHGYLDDDAPGTCLQWKDP